MENEAYQETYYSYLRQLTEEYITGGGFDEFYNRTRSQIDSLVENDPTAFYTYEEYLTAVETLYEVVQLRGESINGQIDGTIPSLESEQRESDALIDASHLDLSCMGSMSMGDNLQNMGSEEFSSNFSPSSFTGGGQPEDFDPSQFRRDSDSTAEKNFVLYLACFALLAAALLFAGLYRRKPRKR